MSSSGRAEHIGSDEIQLGGEPGHELGVGLQSAVVEDVGYRHAGAFEFARDQDRPVTVEGLALGAHNGDAVLLHSGQESLDAFAE
jgi:hypothetical protein